MKTIIITTLTIWFFTFRVCLADQSLGDSSSAENSRTATDAPDVVVLLDLVRSQTDEQTKHIYGVYFVQIDTNNAGKIKAALKDFVPRVEVGTNNAVFTSKGLIDKLSQRPAELFWAKVEARSDNVVTVAAGYYISPEGSVSFEYKLKWDGTKWVIIGRKEGMVS